MCKCTDPKTGEVKEVPAKIKEMVYRTQAPWIAEAISKELYQSGKTEMGECGSGGGGK